MVKIKGTRNYIDVYINKKVVRIYGEMIVGGFIAFIDSIKSWSIPKDVIITEKEKEEIISRVIAKSKNSHMVIKFEQ